MLWPSRLGYSILQSYRVLADCVLDFLFSCFKLFSTYFSFLDMAFAMDLVFRTFFDLFIGLPLFTFLLRNDVYEQRGGGRKRRNRRSKQQLHLKSNRGKVKSTFKQEKEWPTDRVKLVKMNGIVVDRIQLYFIYIKETLRNINTRSKAGKNNSIEPETHKY